MPGRDAPPASARAGSASARPDADGAGRGGRRSPARRGTIGLAVGILLGIVAALLPVLRVVNPGPWLIASLSVAVLVLLVSVIGRRFGVPTVVVMLAEIAVWALALTAQFLGSTAWLGFLPSPDTFAVLPELVGGAANEIAAGIAPLDAATPLSFLIAASTGALAIVLDHVVITTRLPLLGGIALVAVALVPALVVPAAMQVVPFALLAASILYLLHAETRTRGQAEPEDSVGEPRGDQRAVAASVWAGFSALAIGAVVVVVTLVVTPLLPAPEMRVGIGGVNGSVGINPTLRLGDDLRRPNPVEVLTLTTSARSAPYLRAVTLSGFEGNVWVPDGGDPVPIGSGGEFGAVQTAEEIGRTPQDTEITVGQLSTPYLPLPFPATSIDGLDGNWGILADNRTVVGTDESASGQDYTVSTDVPTPTLAQIRAAPSRGARVDRVFTSVPDQTPDLVHDLAVQVTAGTDDDYDAVAALQRWFRSSEFEYSLDAPVAEGFDGPGVLAVTEFLKVRKGYCVHFASAFALMARTLGIPTRIVIGYLPGATTSDRVGEKTVYAVTSDLLHAWPEVYFEGIGWVGFEPTNSLGVPPTFSVGASGSTGTEGGSSPTPTTPPRSAAPTSGATDRPDFADDAAASSGAGTSGTAWPVVLLIVLVALVVAIPAIVRAVSDRALRRRARLGEVRASWSLVQNTAIDLALGVPVSESPRAFGARLTTLGAPASAMDALVDAIERASYAPAGEVATSESIADAAAAVRAGLRAEAGGWRRLIARVAPRSLVVRPGSAAAGARSAAR